MAKEKNAGVLDEPDTAVVDADIERYETMPLAEVNRELRAHNIQAQGTIAAVKGLINSHRARPEPKRGR
jgi:hypothetical protein